MKRRRLGLRCRAQRRRDLWGKAEVSSGGGVDGMVRAGLKIEHGICTLEIESSWASWRMGLLGVMMGEVGINYGGEVVWEFVGLRKATAWCRLQPGRLG
ncbi:hypothetical protein M0R45_030919 [Rubus argutus]|uniref:Uncharacterized protein n=1 Tax=Rubus argutus TaxID=59490 RepID=A0AAW1WGR5_RUBAR